MILNIDSIILRRNKKVLFSNLSLNLPESQILILKGSNGVGKSSLLEAICGLVEIDNGEIFLTKNKLDIHYPFTNDYFFYLGHENCLKDNLTVIENLLMWSSLSNLNLGKDEIFEKLSYFSISFLSDYPLYKLSQGQKRKVALTKLLFSKKPIWVLDEPINGLDQTSIIRFNELLKSHKKKGGSALLTSHIDINVKPILKINLDRLKNKTKDDIDLDSWASL